MYGTQKYVLHGMTIHKINYLSITSDLNVGCLPNITFFIAFILKH